MPQHSHPFAEYLTVRGMPTGFLSLIDWSTVQPAVDDQPLCYVIQAGEGGPVKVGVATVPSKRLADLQVANHEPLRLVATLPGGYRTESRLHALLADHAIRGEWFAPSALPIIHATA